MQVDQADVPLVTVVVPVFEPGPAIEPCIDSLLAQSLPPSALEVIFVDDGSRDVTPARLDALAAEHPHVRVIHEPGSGWAGRPRNVGVDAARGRYVQFVDQDDRLAPEALERCAAMADANGTDIVIGKVTSDFRGVPHGLFRQDRERCTVWDTPLIDSLTPHKLFRTAFLRDNDIRFPEGKRRLEDQLFMVRAYFSGATASILASYPCYFYLRRQDGANAGSRTIDPAGYYGNLREVLDVVVAGTEPGPDRDRFLARFLRVEMLGRLQRDFATGDEAYRDALVTEIADIIETVMTPGAIASLSPIAMARARLVRERATDRLVTLAERLGAITATAVMTDTTWHRGRLESRLDVTLQGEDGDAIRIDVIDGRSFLDGAITRDILAEPLEVGAAVAHPRLRVFAESADDGVLWRVREREVLARHESTGALQVSARIVLDPERDAGGPFPAGPWRFRARLVVAGLDGATPVTGPGRGSLAFATEDPARLHEFRERDGRAILGVGDASWQDVLVGRPVRHRPSGGRRLVAGLDVAAPPGDLSRSVPVRIRMGSAIRERTGLLLARRGRWWLALTVGPFRGRLRPGHADVEAALDGAAGDWAPLGRIEIDRMGRVGWQGIARVGTLGSGRYHLVRSLKTLSRPVLDQARRVRRFVRARRQGAGA